MPIIMQLVDFCSNPTQPISKIAQLGMMREERERVARLVAAESQSAIYVNLKWTHPTVTIVGDATRKPLMPPHPLSHHRNPSSSSSMEEEPRHDIVAFMEEVKTQVAIRKSSASGTKLPTSDITVTTELKDMCIQGLMISDEEYYAGGSNASLFNTSFGVVSNTSSGQLATPHPHLGFTVAIEFSSKPTSATLTPSSSPTSMNIAEIVKEEHIHVDFVKMSKLAISHKFLVDVLWIVSRNLTVPYVPPPVTAVSSADIVPTTRALEELSSATFVALKPASASDATSTTTSVHRIVKLTSNQKLEVVVAGLGDNRPMLAIRAARMSLKTDGQNSNTTVTRAGADDEVQSATSAATTTFSLFGLELVEVATGTPMLVCGSADAAGANSSSHSSAALPSVATPQDQVESIRYVATPNGDAVVTVAQSRLLLLPGPISGLMNLLMGIEGPPPLTTPPQQQPSVSTQNASSLAAKTPRSSSPSTTAEMHHLTKKLFLIHFQQSSVTLMSAASASSGQGASQARRNELCRLTVLGATVGVTSFAYATPVPSSTVEVPPGSQSPPESTIEVLLSVFRAEDLFTASTKYRQFFEPYYGAAGGTTSGPKASKVTPAEAAMLRELLIRCHADSGKVGVMRHEFFQNLSNVACFKALKGFSSPDNNNTSGGGGVWDEALVDGKTAYERIARAVDLDTFVHIHMSSLLETQQKTSSSSSPASTTTSGSRAFQKYFYARISSVSFVAVPSLLGGVGKSVTELTSAISDVTSRKTRQLAEDRAAALRSEAAPLTQFDVVLRRPRLVVVSNPNLTESLEIFPGQFALSSIIESSAPGSVYQQERYRLAVSAIEIRVNGQPIFRHEKALEASYTLPLALLPQHHEHSAPTGLAPSSSIIMQKKMLTFVAPKLDIVISEEQLYFLFEMIGDLKAAAAVATEASDRLLHPDDDAEPLQRGGHHPAHDDERRTSSSNQQRAGCAVSSSSHNQTSGGNSNNNAPAMAGTEIGFSVTLREARMDLASRFSVKLRDFAWSHSDVPSLNETKTRVELGGLSLSHCHQNFFDAEPSSVDPSTTASAAKKVDNDNRGGGAYDDDSELLSFPPPLRPTLQIVHLSDVVLQRNRQHSKDEDDTFETDIDATIQQVALSMTPQVVADWVTSIYEPFFHKSLRAPLRPQVALLLEGTHCVTLKEDLILDEKHFLVATNTVLRTFEVNLNRHRLVLKGNPPKPLILLAEGCEVLFTNGTIFVTGAYTLGSFVAYGLQSAIRCSDVSICKRMFNAAQRSRVIAEDEEQPSAEIMGGSAVSPTASPQSLSKFPSSSSAYVDPTATDNSAVRSQRVVRSTVSSSSVNNRATHSHGNSVSTPSTSPQRQHTQSSSAVKRTTSDLKNTYELLVVSVSVCVQFHVLSDSFDVDLGLATRAKLRLTQRTSTPIFATGALLPVIEQRNIVCDLQSLRSVDDLTLRPTDIRISVAGVDHVAVDCSVTSLEVYMNTMFLGRIARIANEFTTAIDVSDGGELQQHHDSPKTLSNNNSSSTATTVSRDPDALAELIKRRSSGGGVLHLVDMEDEQNIPIRECARKSACRFCRDPHAVLGNNESSANRKICWKCATGRREVVANAIDVNITTIDIVLANNRGGMAQIRSGDVLRLDLHDRTLRITSKLQLWHYNPSFGVWEPIVEHCVGNATWKQLENIAQVSLEQLSYVVSIDSVRLLSSIVSDLQSSFIPATTAASSVGGGGTSGPGSVSSFNNRTPNVSATNRGTPQATSATYNKGSPAKSHSNRSATGADTSPLPTSPATPTPGVGQLSKFVKLLLRNCTFETFVLEEGRHHLRPLGAIELALSRPEIAIALATIGGSSDRMTARIDRTTYFTLAPIGCEHIIAETNATTGADGVSMDIIMRLLPLHVGTRSFLAIHNTLPIRIQLDGLEGGIVHPNQTMFLPTTYSVSNTFRVVPLPDDDEVFGVAETNSNVSPPSTLDILNGYQYDMVARSKGKTASTRGGRLHLRISREMESRFVAETNSNVSPPSTLDILNGYQYDMVARSKGKTASTRGGRLHLRISRENGEPIAGAPHHSIVVDAAVRVQNDLACPMSVDFFLVNQSGDVPTGDGPTETLVCEPFSTVRALHLPHVDACKIALSVSLKKSPFAPSQLFTAAGAAAPRSRKLKLSAVGDAAEVFDLITTVAQNDTIRIHTPYAIVNHTPFDLELNEVTSGGRFGTGAGRKKNFSKLPAMMKEAAPVLPDDEDKFFGMLSYTNPTTGLVFSSPNELPLHVPGVVSQAPLFHIASQQVMHLVFLTWVDTVGTRVVELSCRWVLVNRLDRPLFVGQLVNQNIVMNCVEVPPKSAAPFVVTRMLDSNVGERKSPAAPSGSGGDGNNQSTLPAVQLRVSQSQRVEPGIGFPIEEIGNFVTVARGSNNDQPQQQLATAGQPPVLYGADVSLDVAVTTKDPLTYIVLDVPEVPPYVIYNRTYLPLTLRHAASKRVLARVGAYCTSSFSFEVSAPTTVEGAPISPQQELVANLREAQQSVEVEMGGCSPIVIPLRQGRAQAPKEHRLDVGDGPDEGRAFDVTSSVTLGNHGQRSIEILPTSRCSDVRLVPVPTRSMEFNAVVNALKISVVHKQVEITFGLLEGVKVHLKRTEQREVIQFNVNNIQFDNQSEDAPVFETALVSIRKQQDQHAVALFVERKIVLVPSVIRVDEIRLDVAPLAVHLTDAMLLSLLGFIQDFKAGGSSPSTISSTSSNSGVAANSSSASQQGGGASAVGWRIFPTMDYVYQESPRAGGWLAVQMFIERIVVNPIILRVWFVRSSNEQDVIRQQLKQQQAAALISMMVVSLDDVIITAPGITAQNENRKVHLQIQRFVDFYVAGLNRQLIGLGFQFASSLPFIGVPIRLVSDVGSGAVKFFKEPIDGLTTSPKAFALGLAKGSVGLVGNVLGGGFTAVANVANATSNIARIASGTSQKEHRSGNVVTGLVAGLTGLVTKPMKGYAEEGATGLLKGIGKGVIGVAAAPVGGLLSDVGRITGAAATVFADKYLSEVKRMRPVRLFHAGGAIAMSGSIVQTTQFQRRPYGGVLFSDRELLPTDGPTWSPKPREQLQAEHRFPADRWAVETYQTTLDGWTYCERYESESHGSRITKYTHVRRRRWVAIVHSPTESKVVPPSLFLGGRVNNATTTGSTGGSDIFRTSSSMMTSSSAIAHATASTTTHVEVKTVETFENQRKYPIKGWSSSLMPTDRSKWSSRDGKDSLPKEAFALPEGWEWDGDWEVYVGEGFTDKSGWAYAVDFPSGKYTPREEMLDYVRRRCWRRRMKRSVLTSSFASPNSTK
ncbi:Hypothetical protein, putative [Bodo saltans]|uniref:Peroxin/Ferlin domain-containing protein n=1 Tax=Bodo saltans TaxID=75058 RepID=A0A0S4IMT3_BODSA|nr:Hypothetical protein, putative [Bodo saltans]|eukprot:CUF52755.1 Hypothetical protein, putative [Bodo saltans]